MSDITTRLTDAETRAETLGLTELATSEVPPEVQTWLARLALLYGVPFEHLVPDTTMLPVESIRFFYVDANWLEAMVDGAFSVGVHSQRDIRFHRLLQPAVRDATDIAAGTLRRDLRGESVEESTQSDEEPAEPSAASDQEPTDSAQVDDRVRGGFLMRSEIVAGWPGLEVAGYVGPDTSSEVVEISRLDRLAPDLLLCLFDRIPGLVVVNEPREDLHFAVGDAVAWRGPPENRRLNVNLLAQGLANSEPFGPGDFAAQMIGSPGEQYFVPIEADGG